MFDPDPDAGPIEVMRQQSLMYQLAQVAGEMPWFSFPNADSVLGSELFPLVLMQHLKRLSTELGKRLLVLDPGTCRMETYVKPNEAGTKEVWVRFFCGAYSVEPFDFQEHLKEVSNDES